MKLKNQLLAVASVMFVLSSCQKDLTVPPEESLQGETVSSNLTANEVVETSPPIWTSVVTNVNSNVAGFWQGIPARYGTTTKSYPLIVFIHGIGELGTSLSRMNCCGLPRHMYTKTFPANFSIGGVNHSFLVIAPQFKYRPTAAQVQSVIDFAKRRWRVDASRVYVTGLSMGGGSTFDWSAVYGQNAAAIVPVCAGTKPSTTLASQVASKNLPIWGLYSTADAAIPEQWGKDWINWVDARNPAYASKTKLTIWTDVTHNGTWGRAFNPTTKVDGYNIYQWMLLHKRGTTSTTSPTTTNQLPVARTSDNRVIPLSWNYMPTVWGNTSTDADGYITSYKWTKISGPSSYLIETPYSSKTRISRLVAGTYVFRLTVTDNKGGVDTDDVTITMTTSETTTSTTSGNQAPIARTSNNKTIPLSWNYMPTVYGTTSTDADGWIAAFRWTKVSGPSSYLIETPTAGKTRLSRLVAGTYVFRVTVTDNKGATDSDDITITMTNN